MNDAADVERAIAVLDKREIEHDHELNNTGHYLIAMVRRAMRKDLAALETKR